MKRNTTHVVAVFIAVGVATASGQNVYFGEGGAIDGGGFGCGDVDGSPLYVFGEINISGELGTEIESVEFIGFRHTWAGNLEITLDGPDDFTTRLLDRPGADGFSCGSGADFVTSNTYEWSNDGTLFPEAPGDPIPSGDYFPTGNFGVASSPLPTGDLNGTWTLTIRNGSGSDTGAIEGWSITVVPEPSAGVFLALGGLGMLRRRWMGAESAILLRSRIGEVPRCVRSDKSGACR